MRTEKKLPNISDVARAADQTGKGAERSLLWHLCGFVFK